MQFSSPLDIMGSMVYPMMMNKGAAFVDPLDYVSGPCMDVFSALALDVYTILAGIWYTKDARFLKSSQADLALQYGNVEEQCGMMGSLFTTVMDGYIPQLKQAMGMAVILGIFFQQISQQALQMYATPQSMERIQSGLFQKMQGFDQILYKFLM